MNKGNHNMLDSIDKGFEKFWLNTAIEGPFLTLTLNLKPHEIENEIVNISQMIYLNNQLTMANIRRQHKLMNLLSDSGIRVNDENAPFMSVSCKTLDNAAMKITIDNVLPHLPKIVSEKHYRLLRDTWIPLMTEAILKENPQISLGNAFVFIEQTYPDRTVRDIDNRFRTFIFDSLVNMNIIKDDNISCLSVMEQSKVEKGVRLTEIYVMDKEKMLSFLDGVINM